jgi:hypothetical protein
MRTILCSALLGCAAMTLVVSAQQRVSFDAKADYILTVEKQTAADVNAWWLPFVAQNTLEGYCWNLTTLPLADRSQLGTRPRCSVSAAPDS